MTTTEFQQAMQREADDADRSMRMLAWALLIPAGMLLLAGVTYAAYVVLS